MLLYVKVINRLLSAKIIDELLLVNINHNNDKIYLYLDWQEA